ncbi:VOC family protein [Roseovarius indicus]|uniref:VOC family protein n=1 Tax=Roseovarius indicus TaxID=540747 RepID=UPI0007D926AF|nr:VOC family protein [Roseovarius indicus]OAO01322.1 bleomycin resistance protein [Roseovarius indicus]
MTVTLNHTIIHASDPAATADYYTEILGLPPSFRYGPFVVVQVGETSLDFSATDDAIASRHFAFLVSEAEFDEIFTRITDRGIDHWADPYRRQPDQINTRDGGRGVYFPDPDGHLLEILTRPYGSGSA